MKNALPAGILMAMLFPALASGQSVRPAVFAGSFYPEDPAALAAEVDGFLAAAAPAAASSGRTIGLIVPHAGYVYSGRTAAAAYAFVRGRKIEIVGVMKRQSWPSLDQCLMLPLTNTQEMTVEALPAVFQDVDPADISRVLHAVATRWQPGPASLIINQSFHMPIDPSLKEMFLSSKIVIDATRQLSSEGGPELFPEDLRTALKERVPESFDLVEKKWDSYFRK